MTGCRAAAQGITDVMFAVKYMMKMKPNNAALCPIAQRGNFPTNAMMNIKTGINSNKWIKPVCFVQFTGFTKMANPAKNT